MAVTKYRNVIHMTEDLDEVLGESLIQAVHFTSPLSDNHTAIVKEISYEGKIADIGPIIAYFSNGSAGGGGFIWFRVPLRVDGFVLATLDSGEVTVYLA